MHKDEQIRMDFSRYMESNRSEESEEEKGIRLLVTTSQRETSRSIQSERQISKDISEKRQKTVCDEKQRKQMQPLSERI